MRLPLKKAREYTDEELKREFNYLREAGIFKRHTYKILGLHRDTFKVRMLRLESPELYRARHRRIWQRRVKNLEAPKEPEYGWFFDVDGNALRQFRKDFQKRKLEISVKEAKDPYY